MTDGELVRHTLAGRTTAYDQLVRKWASRVTAVCHARVGRADVAEELAQEALFRGFKAIASLAEVEKFGPWLCGIATRVCLDWLKDKDRTQVSFSAIGEDARPEEMPDHHTGGPDPELDEDLKQLMDEVQKLPPKHREVLMLYYYEDCTYEDLAKILECSAATINARLTQARQMLREKLTRGVGTAHH
ncbi:MAG TPA: RNA polymerase sigma factor [Tepidisphaeraceae bacterium]|jgi:RNA polymerase sigma-70 factor (ECF subfamily)|nr:RNA polymerase sigma factor [Tepidisphaeraceae bacterium]